MLRDLLSMLTDQIVPLVELMALIVITIGTVEAFVRGIPGALKRDNAHPAIRAFWMRYSRWLVAGLTFQLAADIIETSIAPSWDEIGKLAAIAVIRTFLNFFLERDQCELREIEEDAAPTAPTHGIERLP